MKDNLQAGLARSACSTRCSDDAPCTIAHPALAVPVAVARARRGDRRPGCAPTPRCACKDVASLQGAAPVPLIGYGLVVGLNKTGDRRQTMFSAQTLANMLERFGVLVPGEDIKIENVAAVLVTAELPAVLAARQPPRRHGVVDRRRPQPAGRHAAADAAARPRRRRSTRWRRARCRSAASAAAGRQLGAGESPHRRPRAGGRRSSRPSRQHACRRRRRRSCSRCASPTSPTRTRVADAINAELGPGAARALDAASVQVSVPANYRGALPNLMARLEPLPVVDGRPGAHRDQRAHRHGGRRRRRAPRRGRGRARQPLGADHHASTTCRSRTRSRRRRGHGGRAGREGRCHARPTPSW